MVGPQSSVDSLNPRLRRNGSESADSRSKRQMG